LESDSCALFESESNSSLVRVGVRFLFEAVCYTCNKKKKKAGAEKKKKPHHTHSKRQGAETKAALKKKGVSANFRSRSIYTCSPSSKEEEKKKGACWFSLFGDDICVSARVSSKVWTRTSTVPS